LGNSFTTYSRFWSGQTFGENFIHWAKRNKQTVPSDFIKNLIPRQFIVKQTFCRFSTGIFSVGIAVAKGMWVNQSHAQLDAMHRSRSAV
jgi:hypothetical protein